MGNVACYGVVAARDEIYTKARAHNENTKGKRRIEINTKDDFYSDNI